MNNQITTLAPLTFPLTGSHLIEASAGTGKTFTIAMLYVRLILGHRDDIAFTGGALTPPEILVVTFTEAATKELRDRIRARLAEAARYFRDETGSINPADESDLLYKLRTEYPENEWPACAYKLELAAEWMDEAAVSTIHGWCNRMLREHAFDSQSLFTQNLETDQSELQSEVVRDYWRIFFYPMTVEEAKQVKAYWSCPSELEAAVDDLLEHVEALPPSDEPAHIIRANLEEKKMILDALKAPWAAWADELQGIFDKAKAAGEINGQKMRVDRYTSWLDSLRNWATDPDKELLEIGAGWTRLTPAGIADAWKTKTPPDHPALHEIPRLSEALGALPEPKTALLIHAARWIAEAFKAAQKHRAQIGFSDLLTGLEAALAGPYGAQLADTIRRQFPVALIDEFQDTDPVQYRIFERVYEISMNRQDCALILIGDPKQAIYAFRGADIYTYLRARTAVGSRLYTLDTNYRSTQAMVDATNHCFNHSEVQDGSAGAFLFRNGEDNPVPFSKVKANGRKDAFLLEGKTLPAMMLAVLADQGELSKTAYISQMSEICATQIVEWLNQGALGQAGFADPERKFKPVKPGDVAILVNNGTEATAIRQALSRRGIRSVYLSDKETVYATRQATEVYRWLAACAEPDNDRLVRAALSTPSLQLSYEALDALNNDEEAWEARIVQFKGYQAIWQKQGCLPMLRRILIDFQCNDHLLALESDPIGQSGERILTDILHLAELLQQASFKLEGEHALIRFLAEQIAKPEGDSDGKKLRLESDADLVKVVTIHKSKGLEYPLVFLPFICANRLTKNTDTPLKWHDENGDLQISLAADPDVLVGADHDRLGEDLRKIYVALTRARHLTWLGLSPISKSEPNAIGHLFGLSGVDAGQYQTAIHAFAGGQASLSVIDTHRIHSKKFVAKATSSLLHKACTPIRSASEHWWISSYSALQIDGHAIPSSSSLDDTPQSENLLEGEREVTLPVKPGPRASAPMHRFPRGADAGTFLHDLMEWAAKTGFTTVLSDPVALRDMIARRCKVRGWEAWVDHLFDWVKQMLTTPLKVGSASICLEDLSIAKAEMEFWFEAKQVDLARLDAEVIKHTLGARPRPHLTPNALNGMLKGFMDLVFLFDGRYYVADYKSNWLGTSDEAYTEPAMDEAIRIHRYDLQYVIYLLALHRLLKSRLADYDYEKHVGGAAYLFVRGLGASTSGVHFERPPKSFIENLDEMFAGKSGGAA
jgi:exodeoxyribonuclease V beta subunit